MTETRRKIAAVPSRLPASGRGRVAFLGDDVSLLQALRSGHPGAPAELFDRYGQHIQRVLVNVMGADDELADLLHETFAQAFKSIDKLEDGAKLKAWLTRIAVFVARGCIRKRSRGRWLRFFSPEQLPAQSAAVATPELREAAAETYALLQQLPADLRIPFALRYIEGMELKEVASACGVSLATIKRRISKAEQRFVARAARSAALAHWLQEGARWSTP